MAMTPLALTARSHPNRVRQAGGARLVNGMAEMVTGGNSRAQAFPVMPREGLGRFADLIGTGGIRGAFPVDEATLLALAGTTLSSVAPSGASQVIGTIPGAGLCRFARNRRTSPQVVAVADGRAFLIEGTALRELQVPHEDTGFVAPIDVAFLSGYIVFVTRDGKMHFTAVDDATGVSALNYVSAEGNTDGLWRVLRRKLELWLFGDETIEVWTTTGDISAPFQRLPGVLIEWGILAPDSLVKLDQRMAWVADDASVALVDQGYEPQTISTPDVARAIAKVDPLTIRGMSYTLADHEHYLLSCPEWTWGFDFHTGQWSERDTEGLARWRAEGSVSFAGRVLAGDVALPRLYVVGEDQHLDDDRPIVMRTVLPQVHAYPAALVFDGLRVDVVGPGTADPSAPDWQRDPRVRLRWSDDGGASWSPVREQRIGLAGGRRPVRFNHMGQSRDIGRLIEISLSAGPDRALLGVAADLRLVGAP